jgi:hypothetical protein
MKRRHMATRLVLLASIWAAPAVAQTCKDADLLLAMATSLRWTERKGLSAPWQCVTAESSPSAMTTRSQVAPVPVPSCLTCTGARFCPDLLMSTLMPCSG